MYKIMYPAVFGNSPNWCGWGGYSFAPGKLFLLRRTAFMGSAYISANRVNIEPARGFDSSPLPVAQFVYESLSIIGAGGGSRTPVSTLGRSHNGRYTTPAQIAYRRTF